MGWGRRLTSEGLLLSCQGLRTLTTDALWIGEGFSLREGRPSGIAQGCSSTMHPRVAPHMWHPTCGTPQGCDDTGLLESLREGETFLGL